MRVLVLPIFYYGTPYLMRTSCMERMRFIAMMAVRLDPNIRFTFVLPSHELKYSYDEIELFGGHPRIDWVYVQIAPTDWTLCFEEEFMQSLNPMLSPKFAYDVIWTAHQWTIPTLRRMVSSRKLYHVPIVSFMNDSPTRHKHGYNALTRLHSPYQFGEFAGSMMSTIPTFNSQKDKMDTVREMSYWWSRSAIKHVLEDGVVIPAPLAPDFPSREEWMKKRSAQPNKRPTVFYGGPNRPQKQLDIQEAAFSRAMACTADIRFLLSFVSDDVPEFCDKPGIEARTNQGYHQYMENMVEGDIVLVTDRWAFCSIAPAQTISSGMVPIFYKSSMGIDFEELDPPFVARHAKDMAKLLVFVVKNPDEAREMNRSVFEKVRERHDCMNVALRMLGVFERARQMALPRMPWLFSGALHELILDVLVGLPDQVTIDDVFRGMQRKSKTGTDFQRRSEIITAWDMRQIVLANGFVDLCGKDVVFQRKEGV